ncbi:MAG: 30S ribosomal protein S17 [Parcubacteria group bacterium CG08_land_8_20_14_0_20_48_21]|nr:MAG: 30S ribosomal protein S17 [Parcubacteria group bacterium CG2_30_48_51]PIS32633.1 MAG: 30S ribosomal protein S17 [Parcubacteria group bacterium CG08_land_8_20_14_0_20_48_21]PIW79296.1 MAG: 30S ribosomal protein S17 [Parcubacteria group bacterium CG_4_8_14_3_um_filter_48_16]PIY77597.1 MAG: 30S ribosomal protein S17 [Parcubacteria group bacterium CG_4_10_14_0_8_um_filter_48_154]PIZ77182.1 MAG: 30S ribosomal protein S17 [bacterium CG_4_10_14_0_2_um_filter_48_144]PJC40136.1 MAG: 30S ribosom
MATTTTTTSTITKPRPRIFTGTVVSDTMRKTLVVRVDRVIVHPKYQKRYTSSKKYKVHDEHESHKVGEVVRFQECRPLSRDKRWRVIAS